MENIYLQLITEIEELSCTIKQIRDEIERYLKMGNVFSGPSGIRGVDYSMEKVMTSGKISFGDAIKKIDAKENILKPYLEQLATLKRLKKMFDELEKDKCDTLQAKVYYLRFVKKYTQRQTADELGYSERQVQRIEKRIKDSHRNM